MKTTGIVRGIDSLGRIVLPKELRTNMHIDKDSKLEIFVEGDQIILKKHRPAGSCDFCGELAADMAQYEGYCICPACRPDLFWSHRKMGDQRGVQVAVISLKEGL